MGSTFAENNILKNTYSVGVIVDDIATKIYYNFGYDHSRSLWLSSKLLEDTVLSTLYGRDFPIEADLKWILDENTADEVVSRLLKIRKSIRKRPMFKTSLHALTNDLADSISISYWSGPTLGDCNIRVISFDMDSLTVKIEATEDQTGETFYIVQERTPTNQDFASDTGFTYDSGKTEFTGGLVRQKSNLSGDITAYASYDSSIDLDVSGGDSTGTSYGGAGINFGYLNLSFNDVRYVEYDATGGNIGSMTIGAVRFKITPNYSGSPSQTQFLVTLYSGVNNRLRIYHDTGGTLTFTLYGASNFSVSGAWSPTASTEYEIEVNWDNGLKEMNIFVDGVLLDDRSGHLVVVSSPDNIRVGHNSNNNNFKIRSLGFFDARQHTTDYTPEDVDIYQGDVITLPTFNNLGTAFSGFSATDSGNPRYVIDGKYWDGTAWVTSSNTWATANPESIIDLYISELDVPGGDALVVKMITQNSNSTQQSCSDLTVEFVENRILTEDENDTIRQE